MDRAGKAEAIKTLEGVIADSGRHALPIAACFLTCHVDALTAKTL